MDRGERRHNRRVSGYERRALRLMRWAAEEAARLVQLYGGGKAGEPFRIDRSMPLRRAVDALLKDLHAALLGEVQRGVYREWTVAESEADALAARAEGMYPVREAERTAWRTHRDEAREAFTARRERGLSLSDRVWRVVDGFAAEVETAATEAIGNGTPAERLATSIKQHLNEPNRLYRRVRTTNGKLRLSKAAAAYHPGRGVYRSSFMNARRLAVTETNMAYRTADHERWQQMDFVVGIEIRLSNNHNCKGVPNGTFHDICDELAGRYPKDFKFTGWHPHCRCHAVPILKRPEEMGRQGDESANAVSALPGAFVRWVRRQGGRIEEADGAGKMPYFLRDNRPLWMNAHRDERIAALLDGHTPPIAHTAQWVVEAGGRRFRRAIAREKARNPNGWMVDVHEDYSDCKCFLTADGKAGVAVTADGDIVSLFSSVRRDCRSERLVMMAIANGGCKCDCYGGGLEKLYARFGARVVGKTPFNREYAPADWLALPDGDPRKKEYPVVAMIFPRSVKESVRLWKTRGPIHLDRVRQFDSYDELINYRDSLLK